MSENNAIEKVKSYVAKFLPVYVSIVALGVPNVAFAEGNAVTSSSFSGIITTITGQISVSTVAEVLTYAAGIAIGLVFFWWGVRKAISVLMSAWRKGRASI